MNRTLVLPLKLTSAQVAVLQQTLAVHTACFNTVATEGFLNQCSNGVELHKRTYHLLRTRYPNFPAQLVCAARVKATEAVKSALTWQKKHANRYHKLAAREKKQGKKPPVFKPVKAPQSACSPIRYDQRSFWVKWESKTASLATIAGRMEVHFVVPKHALLYTNGKVCSADLCLRQGNYFLHVVVSLPAPVVNPCEDVIGIDLGLTHPAVTSQRAFLGERSWKEQERRLFRLRRKLQAKGSKSAKRHLKKLSGQLLRLKKSHDHVLSKRIVQHATPGSLIVLEDLTGIREQITHNNGKSKRYLHSWTFAQFFTFLAYKAEACGIQVVRVDPHYTSQRCSQCGYRSRDNRRSQSLFLCRKCGYCLNADLNASYNIRDKYVSSLADLGISLVGGSPCQAALCLNSLPSKDQGQAPSFRSKGT